jgi:phosphonate C-P lyase system protein PhnG
MVDKDYVLCECELEPLQKFTTELEGKFDIKMARTPIVCMTMIQAEDSVEFQPFYLGEALTTECELVVNGRTGYGICLGDEPARSYCMAFFDAAVQLEGDHLPLLQAFLEEQGARIARDRKLEYNQIMRTRVDFKLMEQD